MEMDALFSSPIPSDPDKLSLVVEWIDGASIDPQAILKLHRPCLSTWPLIVQLLTQVFSRLQARFPEFCGVLAHFGSLRPLTAFTLSILG